MFTCSFCGRTVQSDVFPVGWQYVSSFDSGGTEEQEAVVQLLKCSVCVLNMQVKTEPKQFWHTPLKKKGT